METDRLYRELKPRLLSVAYRLLGRRSEAEDIVHDAFVAFEAADASRIADPEAYLCRAISNRCIDRLRSAAHQREVYVGPWLPEPVPTDCAPADPIERVVAAEQLSTAYLFLLHQLSWAERTVFVLREVLGFEYDEIAGLVGKSATNCRQLAHRAKRSLGAAAEPAGPEKRRAAALIERFASALAEGNVPELLDLLSPASALVADGGGRVRAPLRTVLGAEKIARFFAAILPEVPADLALRACELNGAPGLLAVSGGAPLGAFSFEFAEGRIAAIYLLANPEKLAPLARRLAALAAPAGAAQASAPTRTAGSGNVRLISPSR